MKKAVLLLLLLNCAKVSETQVGGIPGLLSTFSKIENINDTIKNIPTPIVEIPVSSTEVSTSTSTESVPQSQPVVVLEVGIRSGVLIDSLTGWTKCYSESYASSTSLATIKTNCWKQKIMLSCRVNSSQTLQLAAYADRGVVFSTTVGNSLNVSNGVGWYYSESRSMGFSPPNESVSLNSCDTNLGAQRLCWHTGAGNTSGGYRCGGNIGLNAGTNYVREIFHAD